MSNDNIKYQTKKDMGAASAGMLGLILGATITALFVLSDREMRNRASKKAKVAGGKMKHWGNEQYKYFRGKAEETREQVSENIAELQNPKKEPQVKEKIGRSVH